MFDAVFMFTFYNIYISFRCLNMILMLKPNSHQSTNKLNQNLETKYSLQFWLVQSLFCSCFFVFLIHLNIILVYIIRDCNAHVISIHVMMYSNFLIVNTNLYKFDCETPSHCAYVKHLHMWLFLEPTSSTVCVK